MGSKKKISLMEPMTIVRDSVAKILLDEGDVILKGKLNSFTALECLFKIREIDTVFSEVYDESMSVIQGVNFLRKLKKEMPGLKIIIHTEVNIPELLLQTEADVILQKKMSVGECRYIAHDILNGAVPINTFYTNDCAIHQRLNDIEWEVFVSLSDKIPLKEISKNMKIGYKTISRHKISLIRKLGLRNSVQLNTLIARGLATFGNYLR